MLLIPLAPGQQRCMESLERAAPPLVEGAATPNGSEQERTLDMPCVLGKGRMLPSRSEGEALQWDKWLSSGSP